MNHCREKASGSDPCVHFVKMSSVCDLLTPAQVQQLSVPAYKNHKHKEKDKEETQETGDKLVDPASVVVLRPSDTDSMDTSPSSPVKASSKASDQPSSSDFVEFKYSCLPASPGSKLGLLLPPYSCLLQEEF